MVRVKAGDKAGKLLASQLKAREAAHQIGGIRNKNGNLVTNHKPIPNAFKKFYGGVYRSKGQVDVKKKEELF